MINFQDNPIASWLTSAETAVLAIISDIEGPSYRPLGACMTVLDERHWVGTLSSGCIEADIALNAMAAKVAGSPRLLRYGRGSPFIDIKLPCGGGLEILLLPAPNRAVLQELQQHQNARMPVTLRIDIFSGEIALQERGKTERTTNTLLVRFQPEPRFLVFGKGPEAQSFAALANAAGYPNLLLSPDDETLSAGRASGGETRLLKGKHFPRNLDVDERTAIVLFFHDHDWEPEILLGGLKTAAFYIGAQGSRAARETRLERLRNAGAAESDLARLAGPIGLISSARDARTLAISVLAEVVAKLKEENV